MRTSAVAMGHSQRATFHEFQPLAPKETNLPGEFVPKGFMAWERTWLYRVRDYYLVPWKLNEEAINLDDHSLHRVRYARTKSESVAAILETYNDDITLTAEEDAVFAAARQRTNRPPPVAYLFVDPSRGAPCAFGLRRALNLSRSPAMFFRLPTWTKKTPSTSASPLPTFS